MKLFENFQSNESETSDYVAPKFVVKPAKDDDGYALVAKNYKRFIWTWDEYGKKKAASVLDEGVGTRFESTLDKYDIEVDLKNTEYDYVDSALANVYWDEDIDYGKSGISGISAVVKKVTVMLDLVKKDETEEKDVEFEFLSDKIETECEDELPFFAIGLCIDFASKTCVVKFGK